MKKVILALVIAAFSAPAFADNHGHKTEETTMKTEEKVETTAPAKKGAAPSKKKRTAKKEVTTETHDATEGHEAPAHN